MCIRDSNYAINDIIIIFGMFIIVSMGLIAHLYRKHVQQKSPIN